MAGVSNQQLFSWVAFNNKQRKVTGKMLSDNADIVKSNLRRQGLSNIEVKQDRKPLMPPKIKDEDITVFTRQTTSMLKSGVPLVQALALAAEGNENIAMRRLIATIQFDVENGEPLSQAMRKHPAHFDQLINSLVEAGEESGTLDELFEVIASYRERIDALRRKIKKAMTYPIAVLVVAAGVSALLLIKVVPQFEALFAQSGGDLPAFTRKVIDLSEFLQANGLYVLGAIIAVVVGFKRSYAKSESFRLKVDRFFFRNKITGSLVTKSSVARFARTISAMLSAGVTLLDAIQPAAGSTGNSYVERELLEMRESIADGDNMSTVMRDTGMFPSLVIQMFSIGEQSGTIDSMATKVADYYDDQVNSAVDALTSLMEPVIMVVLGVVIGGLILAMYLPIFSMGSAF
ncbi:MAG: type II secretion system F family protein [Gammaproteobacteria bacterium]|nr:type II secretion system F family protein [Gammaproteobacteria bacterium]